MCVAAQDTFLLFTYLHTHNFIEYQRLACGPTTTCTWWMQYLYGMHYWLHACIAMEKCANCSTLSFTCSCMHAYVRSLIRIWLWCCIYACHAFFQHVVRLQICALLNAHFVCIWICMLHVVYCCVCWIVFVLHSPLVVDAHVIYHGVCLFGVIDVYTQSYTTHTLGLWT